MQKYAGSRPVCTFLKREMSCMYAYVLVRTDLYVDKSHTHWYVLVHTDMYWYILVCTSTNHDIHCTYQYIPVHTSMY